MACTRLTASLPERAQRRPSPSERWPRHHQRDYRPRNLAEWHRLAQQEAGREQHRSDYPPQDCRSLVARATAHAELAVAARAVDLSEPWIACCVRRGTASSAATARRHPGSTEAAAMPWRLSSAARCLDDVGRPAEVSYVASSLRSCRPRAHLATRPKRAIGQAAAIEVSVACQAATGHAGRGASNAAIHRGVSQASGSRRKLRRQPVQRLFDAAASRCSVGSRGQRRLRRASERGQLSCSSPSRRKQIRFGTPWPTSHYEDCSLAPEGWA